MRRALRFATLGAAAVAAALLFANSDAIAKNGHSRGHGRHGAAVVAPVRVAPGPYFTAPRTIVVRDAWRYRPYIHDSVYFAPHRHRHVVYRFPVRTAYGVVYSPYAYCGDHLFVPPVPYGAVVYDGYGYRGDDRVSGYVQFGGPDFSVGIGF